MKCFHEVETSAILHRLAIVLQRFGCLPSLWNAYRALHAISRAQTLRAAARPGLCRLGPRWHLQTAPVIGFYALDAYLPKESQSFGKKKESFRLLGGIWSSHAVGQRHDAIWNWNDVNQKAWWYQEKLLASDMGKMNADLPQTLQEIAQLHVGSLMVLALLQPMQMVIEDVEASQPYHLAISCRVMVRMVFSRWRFGVRRQWK